MPTAKDTLAEAKRQLEINLELIGKLKGKTPSSMLTDFKLRYIRPLEELIRHLEQEVRKEVSKDGSINQVEQPTNQRKRRR